MSALQQVLVLMAVTGMITAAVLPGRETAKVVGAGFNGLSKLEKVSQGR